MTTENLEKDTSKLKKCMLGFWNFITHGGALIGFLVGLITMFLFVKNLVYQTATEEEFLHRVASHVRPALIFDENFSILADQGGTEYIEDIDISLNEGGVPTQMVVHAKTHLSYQPFLQSMTANDYLITAKRGKKYDWIFTFKQFGRGGDERHIFRIEIIN